MPDKYHIKTAPMPGQFRRVGKYATVDAREDCSRCTNCVKPRCNYDVYHRQTAHDRDPQAALEPLFECKACLSCVQGCTKGLLDLSINPEYLAMGDEYWTPDLIATTWNQSDTGRIPVSGAGYRGRFTGPGFDSIWTDMSEIVRPTRDGIHGREYISTAVDIGLKPMRLAFDASGNIAGATATLLEAQMPAILDCPPWPMGDAEARLAALRATTATQLKTFAVAKADDAGLVADEHLTNLVPLIASADDARRHASLLAKVRMVEIADSVTVADVAAAALQANPKLLLAVRLDLDARTAGRIAELARRTGVAIKVFHVCGDLHGREKNVPEPRHIKDALRAVHVRLVEMGLRDEVTVIIAGGIGMAEHMAKAIICGADLVALDAPLLIALGCRLCGHDADAATGAERCPAETAEGDYARQRIVNLMGAWHSQMIEVLGAMGIREVRRLRGETGRAIFMEDMEREAFGDLIRK